MQEKQEEDKEKEEKKETEEKESDEKKRELRSQGNLLTSTSRDRSALHAFADDLVCAVCREVFVHPVALCCGHSFCLQCISQWR